MISTPAPSSGIIVLAAVNLFNQLNLPESKKMSTLNYHYLSEVFFGLSFKCIFIVYSRIIVLPVMYGKPQSEVLELPYGKLVGEFERSEY